MTIRMVRLACLAARLACFADAGDAGDAGPCSVSGWSVDDVADLGERRRPAEQEALRLRAGLAVQELALNLVLHALGEHGNVETAAEAEHRGHDHRRLLARANLVDEALVDF